MKEGGKEQWRNGERQNEGDKGGNGGVGQEGKRGKGEGQEEQDRTHQKESGSRLPPGIFPESGAASHSFPG